MVRTNPAVVVGPPGTCGIRDVTDEASQKNNNDGRNIQYTITASIPRQDLEPFPSDQRIPPKSAEKEVKQMNVLLYQRRSMRTYLRHHVMWTIRKTLKN